jgi:hypothetical protein
LVQGVNCHWMREFQSMDPPEHYGHGLRAQIEIIRGTSLCEPTSCLDPPSNSTS